MVTPVVEEKEREHKEGKGETMMVASAVAAVVDKKA